MTRNTRSPGKVLRQFFGRAPKPSADQLAQSRRRISGRLGLATDRVGDSSLTSVRGRWLGRVGLPIAAAAALIVVVGVGVLLRDQPPIAHTVNNGLERSAQPAPIPAGDMIEPGEIVHSKNGGVFRLADGSRVEMRPEAELGLERADDGVRIRLRKGGIVVYAAEQRNGHLYVQTKDVTVSVVGTVFLVSVEEQGSRVSVIAGEVTVQQGARIQRLRPGEQVVTTSETSTAAPQVAAPEDKFDVASIRPASPGFGARGEADRVDHPPTLCSSGGFVEITAKQFIARRTNLTGLIAAAYGNRCPFGDMLSGGPEWVRTQIYDIQAVIPAGTPAYTNSDFLEGKAPHLQRMLQNLLAERFQLRLRREMKEMSVYNLVVAKAGKLKLSEDQSGLRRAPVSGNFGGNSTSMDEYADFLQWSLNRLVLDKTALKGLYDAGINLPRMSFQSNGDMKSRAEAWHRDVVPRALEEQLGLKLQPAKVQVEFLTIEQAEKPTAN